MSGGVHRVLTTLARCAPVRPDGDPDLDRALAFVGSDATSGTVRAAAVGLATVGLVVGTLAASLPMRGSVPMACATVGAGLLGGYALLVGPHWLATARRTRALGDLPNLIGLATLRARVSPSGECAATFAARHGRGPLASSLTEHVRHARGGPTDGWRAFAAAWDGWAPSLRRAVALLEAGVADGANRDALFDRALTAVLDGTRERARSFATSIRGPVGALYAFGVVLPLALVAALPAARSAGVAVTGTVLAVTYVVVLPAVVVTGGCWLVARRPVAFPATPVGDHPDVPARRRRLARTATAAVAAGATGWITVSLVAPTWLRWVATPGSAVGVALYAWYEPTRRVRERVTAVEDGLADALTVAGHRLERGESPEAAVAAVGAELDGPTADAFADAARVQRQLRVGVRRAFLGRDGAAASLPSPRLRACVALLALAGREGGTGGRLLVRTADHLDALRDVERDARHELAATVGSLRSTACCFAPLVGGATVALSSRLDGALAATPLPTPVLGTVVGAYVSLLAVALAGLAVSLETGFDRDRVGSHVGGALLAASVVYPVAVVGAGSLV